MVIGKTSSSISKAELFNKFSEVEVLTTVFPQVDTLPCLISSPLRKDEHPSFGLYLSSNQHVRYIDYAHKEESGGLLDLLCKYWSLSFQQVMDKLCSMLIQGNEVIIKPKQIKVLTRKESDLLTKVQVTVRPWRDYDLAYWRSYGIEPQWLKHAEVYPISHKIVTKKENPKDKGQTYIFPADKYAYAFIERKDGQIQIKIYQPFNTRGYKWCSKMDASVWGLWTKIPQMGDNLIISSSVKDCLNLSCQLHIPAICMQGEGYWPKPQVINELKGRYKNIIVFFDNDYTQDNNPGRTDSIKLATEFNLKRVEIPADYGAKDPSDLFKKYGKEKYLEIMHQILTPVLL